MEEPFAIAPFLRHHLLRDLGPQTNPTFLFSDPKEYPNGIIGVPFYIQDWKIWSELGILWHVVEGSTSPSLYFGIHYKDMVPLEKETWLRLQAGRLMVLNELAAQDNRLEFVLGPEYISVSSGVLVSLNIPQWIESVQRDLAGETACSFFDENVYPLMVQIASDNLGLLQIARLHQKQSESA